MVLQFSGELLGSHDNAYSSKQLGSDLQYSTVVTLGGCSDVNYHE